MRFKSIFRLIIPFLAINTLLVFAVLAFNGSGNTSTWLTWLYTTCVALGYYGLPLLVVVALISLLLAPVRRVAVSAGFLLVMSFVYYLIVDLLTYRIVKFHINPFWAEFIIKDLDGLGLPAFTHLLALAILGGVVALELGILVLSRRFAGGRRVLVVYPLIVILAFAFSQVVHIVSYAKNYQPITSLTPHYPAYVPFTSHRNARKYAALLPLEELEGGTASIRYPAGALEFERPGSELPGVLFILIESWRYDAMSEEITPNIHKLGRRSSVFRNHFSSGNQTTCGIFGLFYGMHPTYWSAVKANSGIIDNPVLIDAFRDRGYAFGIYSRSEFERHKIKDTIFNGIEVHKSFAGRTIPGQVLEFIEEQARKRRPFAGLVFYKSSHCPYEYPPEHEVFEDSRNLRMGLTNGDTDPAPYLRDYYNSLHYVDALVGEITGRLEKLGLLDNTIIVVTTDHGEAFNNNGENYWGHGSGFTRYQAQVPLVLHCPCREPREVGYRTSHIDLAPTILEEYFGCTSDPATYSNGRNLFAEQPRSRPLVIGSYVNHALVFGEDVYEIFPAYTKKYKLSDVGSHADPAAHAQLKSVMNELTRFTTR